MKYKPFFFYFIKFILGFLGYISLGLFVFCILFIIKLTLLSDSFNLDDLYKFDQICKNVDPSISNKKCADIISVLWLLVSLLIFFILTFLMLYPFYLMKKKNNSS
jgi:beta-lactamase regulating signal transducer with metallopeptidase domain